MIHVANEYLPLDVKVGFTELYNTGESLKLTNKEHVTVVLSVLLQKSWNLVVLILNGLVSISIYLMLIVPGNDTI